MGKLKCDMRKDCTDSVTYIDAKGYVYCTDHGIMRKTTLRCRKLKPKEIRTLEAPDPIKYGLVADEDTKEPLFVGTMTACELKLTYFLNHGHDAYIYTDTKNS